MDFNKKEKANKPIIILLFLFILISLICIFFNNQTYDSKISFQNENYLSENWNYNNESIVLPKKTHLNKGDTIILTNTLPSNIKNGDALYFTSNYCINKIYIDNKLVFYPWPRDFISKRLNEYLSLNHVFSQFNFSLAFTVKYFGLFASNYSTPFSHVRT